MNTKYLKIVLLLSILALNVQCQLTDATATLYVHPIEGGVTPRSTSYNFATNTYLVNHQTPNGHELLAFQIEKGVYTRRSSNTYANMERLVSDRTKPRAALLSTEGVLSIIESDNNFVSYKTVWSIDRSAEGIRSALIAWHADTDWVFAGQTNGQLCAFKIAPGQKEFNCKKVLDGAYRVIASQAKTGQVFVSSVSNQPEFFLVDFFSGSSFKAIKYFAVRSQSFLTPDPVQSDIVYNAHESKEIVKYRLFNDVAEVVSTLDLNYPEAIVRVEFVPGSTRILFSTTPNYYSFLDTDGLEILGRGKHVANSPSDYHTMSIGLSDGKPSTFLRAIEPSGRWWSWVVEVYTYQPAGTLPTCPDNQYVYAHKCTDDIPQPQTYGFNAAENTVDFCAVAYCVSCVKDFRLCDTCLTGLKLSSDRKTCIGAVSGLGQEGFGFNPVTGEVEPCADSNCSSCADDSRSCSQCKPTSAFKYLNPVTGKCVEANSIPSGFGIDPSNPSGQVKACKDTNCVDCRQDFSRCAECSQKSAYKLLDKVSGTCISTAELPDGKGYNPQTGTVEACRDTSCAVCSADSRICTKCRKDTAANILDPRTGTCHSTQTLPPGTGLDKTTGQIRDCKDPGCSNCSEDYSFCTKCKTGQFLDIVTGSCFTAGNVPAGLGVNPDTGNIQPCKDPNCASCAEDYRVCKSCNVNSTFKYLNTATGACQSPSTVPAGSGVDPATGTVKRCQDVNCARCEDNFAVCKACRQDGPKSILSEKTGTCISSSEIPSGQGLNPATGQLEKCAIDGCDDCRANYSVCAKCAAGKSLVEGRCAGDIPAGFGKGPNGEIKPCADSNCGDCKQNFKTCASCKSGYQVDSSSGVCKSGTGGGSGTGVGWNPDTEKYEECNDKNCIDCVPLVKVCRGCTQDPKMYLYQGKCILKDNAPDGFGVDEGGKEIVDCKVKKCAEDPNNIEDVVSEVEEAVPVLVGVPKVTSIVGSYKYEFTMRQKGEVLTAKPPGAKIEEQLANHLKAREYTLAATQRAQLEQAVAAGGLTLKPKTFKTLTNYVRIDKNNVKSVLYYFVSTAMLGTVDRAVADALYNDLKNCATPFIVREINVPTYVSVGGKYVLARYQLLISKCGKNGAPTDLFIHTGTGRASFAGQPPQDSTLLANFEKLGRNLIADQALRYFNL
jgi:hypothetical protein